MSCARSVTTWYATKPNAGEPDALGTGSNIELLEGRHGRGLGGGMKTLDYALCQHHDP